MDTEDIIKEALKEDIGTIDITTESILKTDKKVESYITAKEEGIVCGLDIAEIVFRILDKNIIFEKKTEDGNKIKPGQNIAKIIGSAKAMLAGERTALNFLGHLSGIATMTSRYKELCKNATILDTRKTTPLLRELEKYAVRCGGGKNHRMGLYDMILIKDNHIKAAGSIKKALEQASKVKDKKIEIECTTLDEVKEAQETKIPDIIMLDNMTTEDMTKAIKIINRKTKTEASGDVNLNTIKDIDQTGVDCISIGAITKKAPHTDYSMNIRM